MIERLVDLHSVKVVTSAILHSDFKSSPRRAPGPVASHSKVTVSPLTVTPLLIK